MTLFYGSTFNEIGLRYFVSQFGKKGIGHPFSVGVIDYVYALVLMYQSLPERNSHLRTILEQLGSIDIQELYQLAWMGVAPRLINLESGATEQEYAPWHGSVNRIGSLVRKEVEGYLQGYFGVNSFSKDFLRGYRAGPVVVSNSATVLTFNGFSKLSEQIPFLVQQGLVTRTVMFRGVCSEMNTWYVDYPRLGIQGVVLRDLKGFDHVYLAGRSGMGLNSFADFIRNHLVSSIYDIMSAVKEGNVYLQLPLFERAFDANGVIFQQFNVSGIRPGLFDVVGFSGFVQGHQHNEVYSDVGARSLDQGLSGPVDLLFGPNFPFLGLTLFEGNLASIKLYA